MVFGFPSTLRSWKSLPSRSLRGWSEGEGKGTWSAISSEGVHHRGSSAELQTKIRSRYKPTPLHSGATMCRHLGEKVGCLKPVQILAFVLKLQTWKQREDKRDRGRERQRERKKRGREWGMEGRHKIFKERERQRTQFYCESPSLPGARCGGVGLWGGE